MARDDYGFGAVGTIGAGGCWGFDGSTGTKVVVVPGKRLPIDLLPGMKVGGFSGDAGAGCACG